MTVDPQTVAVLRHSILSAATGDTDSILVPQGDAGLETLAAASTSVVRLLLRWVAVDRAMTPRSVAASLHVDLLLLELSDEESDSGLPFENPEHGDRLGDLS
ncbi:hypothetical protein [uncultured Microbacterium sp.]|uniref:hypothetical protein n=1 Tax=uncultured Microbacterium sp. TaxID=191216 RepID=UPI0028EBF92D|nr:hypothetical protein [uncultured Microbacterium sp.]